MLWFRNGNSIGPEEFFTLHKQFGSKIYQYFAPVTISAVVLPQLLLVAAIVFEKNIVLPATVAALQLICLATFYAYFKTANYKFATRGLEDSQLLPELKRWHFVHKFRTVISFVAFVILILSSK